MRDDPYTTDVEVRFRDLDPDKHVNNAVYATYVEQGRAGYYRDVIGLELDRAETVIASLQIEYAAPIQLGDDASVAVSVPELGESSIPMAYEVRADGEVAAEAETVQVTWDEENERTKPIPEDWRRRIEDYEGF